MLAVEARCLPIVGIGYALEVAIGVMYANSALWHCILTGIIAQLVWRESIWNGCGDLQQEDVGLAVIE